METMNIENIVMVNLKNFNKHRGKEKEKLGVHIMAIENLYNSQIKTDISLKCTRKILRDSNIKIQ